MAGSAGPVFLEPRCDVTVLPRAPGHWQNPPNSWDLVPLPFPPTSAAIHLLEDWIISSLEILGQPQNPWIRGEGGPSAVKELPGLDGTSAWGMQIPQLGPRPSESGPLGWGQESAFW